MKRSISPLRRLALAASALMGLTTAAPALAGAVDTTWTQDRDVARMVSLGEAAPVASCRAATCPARR